MPKCENGEVYLPSKEMCRITLNPCKILYESGIFPDFMRCDDEDLFPSECKNDIHELKFNTTGQCMEPLVRTDHPDWVYSGKLFFIFFQNFFCALYFLFYIYGFKELKAVDCDVKTPSSQKTNINKFRN